MLLTALQPAMLQRLFGNSWISIRLHLAFIGGSMFTQEKSTNTSILRRTTSSFTVTPLTFLGAKVHAAGSVQVSLSRTESFQKHATKRLGRRKAKELVEEWVKSINQGRRTIIQCHFRPVYNLTLAGTKAKKWLRRACCNKRNLGRHLTTLIGRLFLAGRFDSDRSRVDNKLNCYYDGIIV